MVKIKIGLAGNPNAGKTTIFNSMTGSNQKVGNYAGVTVEKKEGRKVYRGYEFSIYDLPGTYSLTAYSIDEIITRDFIIDEKPDIIIDVIDSTNIDRNLYLLLQFQEFNIPIIGALNITDQAESMGIKINEKQLSKLLDITMIKTVGSKEKGINDLLDAVIDLYENKKESVKIPSYGYEIEDEIKKIVQSLETDKEFSSIYPPRWIAIKLLEKDKNAYKKILKHNNEQAVRNTALQCIKDIETHFGQDSEIIISEQRYGYIHGAVTETVVKESSKITDTEKIDSLLLNRFLGLPVFLFIIWGIFQLTFVIGAYPQGWLETLFGWLGVFFTKFLHQGMLQSLIVDGVIGGLGGVISFVPLIVLLFMFISILEDSGYMSRAAYIMDKFLHIFGLHGQSFLPLMVGFGCSVPAIMASRTLKNPKDRIITILVTPFMNCGAKLPVYILLAGTFFSEHAGNVVLLIYVIGVALALLSSLLFRKTILKGESTPFVMELPPYRMPTAKGILRHITEKTMQYLKKAGAILLPASVLIWVVISFPKPAEDPAKYEKLESDYKIILEERSMVKSATENNAGNLSKEDAVEEELTIDEQAAEYAENIKREEELAYSAAGRLGRVIEPVIKPLGFDWKIGVATVTGFAAKETVVSTLGILYKTGGEESEESETLRNALKNDKTFNPLVAFVLMLFTLILAPCFAAQATIKAELGWKWLGFYVSYSIFLSWSLCFAVYQIGKFFGLGV